MNGPARRGARGGHGHIAKARESESEETRRLILQVARQLFMEYGYRAVTTRQIAEACGLTQPALYHHFADKEALYLAMAREELARVKAALERIVRRSEPVPERLRHVASYLLTTTQHDLALMLHDIRYELSPAVRAQLHTLFEESLIAPIAASFAEGLQSGLLRSPDEGGVDARMAAYLFMSLMSRFVVWGRETLPSVAESRRESLASEQAALLVRVLLYGLAR
ncbi:TetR/AcrR family transcriptional regulator [Thermogemmatispora sp.]|uniref:TetR/AcrR family transcriptional regulator n=1 Tax=Thermogemmatispora sp. TaxID=1968838 RepID=UPI0035E434CD